MVTQPEWGQNQDISTSSQSDSRAYRSNLFSSLTVVWKLDFI